MVKPNSSQSIIDEISPFWSIKEALKFSGTCVISVECNLCKSINNKTVKKLLEAARAGKSGCGVCFQAHTKTKEYAEIMGSRSTPSGSAARQKQSSALSAHFLDLGADKRKEIYGNPERWTEEERRLHGQRLSQSFKDLPLEKKTKRMLQLKETNQRPDKIQKQKDAMVLNWETSIRNKKIENGTLVMMSKDEGLREYADKKGVPSSWVYRIYNTLGLDAAKKYIDTYDGSVTDIELIIEQTLGIEKFDRKTLERYRPDFKLSDSLYLNTDGIYWHTEDKVGQKYHYDMRATFEEAGKQMLQFYSSEIYHKLPIVKSIVANALGSTSIKIPARKCKIQAVDKNTADGFMTDNHLMGVATGTTAFGLFFKEELVSVMSISRDKEGIEIDRFCSKIGIMVLGGFGKLLKHVEEIYTPAFINSWVDLRYGTGKSLLATGFEKIKDVLSWRWTDGNKTFNRLHCRANMDERNLPQSQHAEEMKLSKIFDAGQRLYTKLPKASPASADKE
jgi:hypothetical protein